MMSATPSLINKFIALLRPGKRKNDVISAWSGNIKKGTLIDKCPFVVLDTELSGRDTQNDFIVSIGAVKMKGKTINLIEDCSP